ncbi:vitellogenin-2-like [Uranotaenia lowii]|uniref:vitellogenin-2-like n=1 Tax=Uranotaenia lowii TaxID=190385 RepID=UPI00247A52E4|nr:vitellogenin-2-like [Uranotaenia lowii]
MEYTDDYFETELYERSSELHASRMCRLCLQSRYLINIHTDPTKMAQLVSCFTPFLPDDSDFPQFICGECYQLLEVTYQFSIRSNRASVLMRTYLYHGGRFPDTQMLQEEYQKRAEKRSPSPEKTIETPPAKKRKSLMEHRNSPLNDKKEPSPIAIEEEHLPKSRAHTEKSKPSAKSSTGKEHSSLRSSRVSKTEKVSLRSEDRMQEIFGSNDRTSAKHKITRVEDLLKRKDRASSTSSTSSTASSSSSSHSSSKSKRHSSSKSSSSRSKSDSNSYKKCSSRKV